MRTKLTVGEKEIPLYFGMMAIEITSEKQQAGMAGWFKLMTDIVWGGYVNAMLIKNKPTEMSYEDISIMMDEIYIDTPGQINEMFKVFEESKPGKKLMQANESLKKKTIK